MTRKQMKKLAKEFYECELIHQDDNASKEEKARAEDRTIHLTNQILALHDGISVLLEIDTIVQGLLENNNN